MPTAAKLVAAIALALAAYGVSQVILYRSPTLQEQGVSHKMFIFVGFFIGWVRLGPAAEKGYRASIGGAIASVVLCYVCLVIIASLDHVYAGMGYHAYQNVDDLVNGLFKKVVEFALLITDYPIALIATFGSILAGIFAAMAGRLWS